jgi:hypothetical protein
MMTYSVNIGKDTESISYNLADENQLNNILFKLRDNESGEINPIDIRNSVLSLWSNCIFKETTSGNNYYIGIDTGNVNNNNNNDLKRKILIGKRSYESEEIYTNSLNSGNSDIIFYNTKKDSINNNQTKVSILAGNNSSLFLDSPSISSSLVSDINLLSFNFINKEHISLKSPFHNVNINNISFPTISNNQISGLNDKILKWESGRLVWSEVSATIGDNIGNSQDKLELFGNVFVNDYLLEFKDSRMVSANLGGVLQGEKFESYSISELLKKIIYSYQPPSCSLRFLTPYDKGFVEIGTTPTVKIEFTINKKTLPTTVSSLQNMIPNIYPSINVENFQKVVGVSTAIISPSPVQQTSYSYNIITGDGIETSSEMLSLVGVFPIFHGVGINNSSNYTGMTFLNKLVEGKSDKNIILIGNGKIYFFYPQVYGVLSRIINNNGDNVVSDFTVTSFNFSSPNGYWTSIQYYIYESISTYSFVLPTMHTFEF